MRLRFCPFDFTHLLPGTSAWRLRLAGVGAVLAIMSVVGYFASPAKRAESAYMTGSLLYQKCTSELYERGFSCRGYIAGVIDYHRLVRSLGTAPGVDFCVPTGTDMDVVAEIVLQYLEHNPQHQDFIAAPAVALALYQAFPCNRKK